MNCRPSTSLFAALLLLAAFAYLGVSYPVASDVYAQEAAPDASQTTKRAIQDKIELVEIRLAIRLQEVEVAKAERRLVERAYGSAAQMMDAEQKLAATENEISRLAKLQGEGLVSEAQVQALEAQRHDAAELAASVRRRNAEDNLSKLAVHDEKIKVLELRAKLAEARRSQLTRRLK